jgi:predicted metalloprotease with PDZ domain
MNLGILLKNVRSFRVANELGEPLKFKKTSKDHWHVETNGAKKVLVQYEYYSASLNAGSTFLDNMRVYVNPVNCLVYVPGRENAPCSLEIELFKELKYSGTLSLNGNTIHAQSYHELVDCPFIFCDEVESNQYQYGGVDFKISFVGIQNVPWERVLKDFQKFTKKQCDDFGAFPVNTFHFIVVVTPYPHYHGVEHLASTIIVLGPTPDVFGTLYDELLGVSSHELYHVWNVKSIRSIDLNPYDYSKENFSQMGYLCEGITTYLGDYYLMASGIWSPDKYFKEFSQVIQKHLTIQVDSIIPWLKVRGILGWMVMFQVLRVEKFQYITKEPFLP